MASHQRFVSNRRKYSNEAVACLSNESDDDSGDEDTDTDDSEVPKGLKDSSDGSENDSTVEMDSEEENGDSSAEDESSSDEQPPRRRPRREKQATTKVFYTKSGRQWTTSEPPKRKIPQANILRQRRGIGPPAASIQMLKDAFQLLITQEMVLVIVKETNRRGGKNIAEWNEQNPDKKYQWKETDSDEIWAFIGLLILGGVHRSKNENLSELWSMVNGRPIFRATMSKNRMDSLLRFCRFDDLLTRDERMKEDKLAPIRELWTMLLAQLEQCYSPGGSLTVDEQLISTRGRCKFRQYMPSKPGKYGIKVFWCCDSHTAYPLKGEVYVGRQPRTAATATDKNRIKNLVKRLVHPWINTGRTITTDNYFTSAELAEDLLGVQTTLVGTIRKNKREIPVELQPNRQRPENSSIFCFDRQLTLVSYVSKKSKAVILLSSLHHDTIVSDEVGKKPEIILYYNDTKNGVDHMDQMVQTYSCRRKTKRWPMTFFFNMIDIAGIAAFVVWTSKNPEWNEGKLHRRRLFLQQLGRSLVDAHLNRRCHNLQAMQRNVRLAMQAIGLQIIGSAPAAVSEAGGKQRCGLCSRERDRKVAAHCASCHIPCCPEHHKIICNSCWEKF